MDTITLLSPAKVNLTFEILGKRADGYHEIKSIMQPVNLFDHVTVDVSEGSGIELFSKGVMVPENETNLAHKAAAAYLEKCGQDQKIEITLDKAIPVGSGLGGGSSNAAAVLIALNRTLKALNEKDLFEIAPVLGADVAFFIRCITAYVEGIGEIVRTLPNFPLFNYVVIYPKFEVSTKEVYEKWDKINEGRIKDISDLETEGINEVFLINKELPPVFSDLEEPAFEMYPELRKYKQLLLSLEAKPVIISGSGSSLFAIFREDGEAKELYKYLVTNSEFNTYLLKGIQGWHRIAD